MRQDRNQATELRKMGKSYNEIGVVLNVPKSTLSAWLGKLEWSKKVANKLSYQAREQHRVRLVALGRVRGQRLKEIYEEARAEAVKELGIFKYYPLFIAGLMLYWGEGDKVTRNQVRITNTDPKMVKLFKLFLTDVCGVPEESIKASLLVYPDLNEEETRVYWASHTGIAIENFTKSTLIKGRHLTKRLGYGICIISTSSTYLKTKILEWIELLPNELMSSEYYASI